MSPDPDTIICSDTSVLLNFLQIDRMDLLASYPNRIAVPRAVIDEVTSPLNQQIERLHMALDAGSIEEIRVARTDQIRLTAAHSSGRDLGPGELAVLAAAKATGCATALDDKKALAYADKIGLQIVNVGTLALLASMIMENMLTIAEADDIKQELKEHYKFDMAIASFSDILPGGN